MDETSTTNTTMTAAGRGSSDGEYAGRKGAKTTAKEIVVDHEFAVEFDNSGRKVDSRVKNGETSTGKGDSTDSILGTMQYPAHQPV